MSFQKEVLNAGSRDDMLAKNRTDVFATQCQKPGNLRLSGPPSGHGTSGGARTCERRVPANLRADSPATMPRELSAGSRENFCFK
ncbi:hypothetical protein PoB_003826700 [Plakobranchus ocellatus]|uniref:Uncharacterized protein n=1 Tax=Plakobranchus ocellatus TaxID=259542 RepID=A0AAV4AXW6_9GAST|nr:hypothetical protein PoB_003826700 [Plakobranchus ocellatus]